MRVRAMVMAAGAGTRLRPLTDEVPKPLVPIANRPVMEYTIENLKKHGITDVVLNLHHHPELIKKHFGNGGRWGMKIRYSYEPKLMGTAGGVKKASAFFNHQTFLITSGDGLTDINFTQLVSYHQRKKSVATLAIKNIDSKFDYGVTLTHSDGRIKEFVEKPQWGDVYSSQVNTGIYVFEPQVLSMIPAGKVHDFGHQVWPALLKQKKPIFGQIITSYWCDVGNFGEYQRAQHDILEGKLSFKVPGRQIRKGIWVEDGAHIERGAKLEGPCLIGKGTRIAKGAVIGPYAVIGHNVRIGSQALLRHCTLWNNVTVGLGVTLEGCVLSHRTVVKESINIFGAIVTPG